ncbi:MAG TPA: NlpC/P60 family N-terminal domain-containing protein [Syntrophales bacterium]|nr:NlpC/P60 family N-terminal domain-containing protein [Syntrophales bacterium]
MQSNAADIVPAKAGIKCFVKPPAFSDKEYFFYDCASLTGMRPRSTAPWYAVFMRLNNIPKFLVLIFLLYACAGAPETIKDIRELNQDHMYYIDKSVSNRELVTVDYQKKMDADYDARYFSPWHREKPFYQMDVVESGFKKYGSNLGYGENKRKHEKSWINDLAANARLENYPNSRLMAITIDNADLRVLPTHKPHFNDPDSSYRGYPFDNLQESSIAANTPVFISHMSKDKAWVLAETPYAVGWLSARSVTVADKNFVKTWESGRYAVIIKDKIPVYDVEGRFLFKAPLGSIFPKIGEDTKSIKLLVAVADKDGKAFIKSAVVSKEAAASKPLRLTTYNIANLANELINEPYGWGGLYQNRDCSAMIRDLFTPFGLWLPRHSADQAKEGGTFIDLRKLSPADKEAMIVKQGVPYLTLIWRRGHIMLYIGSYQGRALVFHNFWGVKTKDFLGRESRKIVGHAAITTIHPGLELHDVGNTESDLLSGVLGMTVLVSPEYQETINKER